MTAKQVCVVMVVAVAVVSVFVFLHGVRGARSTPDVAAMTDGFSLPSWLAPPTLGVGDLRFRPESCVDGSTLVVSPEAVCEFCIRTSSSELRMGKLELRSGSSGVAGQVEINQESGRRPPAKRPPCRNEAAVEVVPQCLGKASRCDEGKGAQLNIAAEGGRLWLRCVRGGGPDGREPCRVEVVEGD